VNATPPAPAVAYPLRLEVDYQEEYPRWLPLLASILLIPHFIALIILGIGAYFALIVSWLAVLFTGRFPEGVFNYLVGVHRWATRVFAYYLWMTSKYPAFSLQEVPGDTVRFSIEYPPEGRMSRWRVFQAILLIPFYIALYFFGLVFILLFIPFFQIIFTKKYSKGIFDLMLVWLRWNARAQAYATFMVTKYPPFELV
jgi:Domain of unknown function (DUF4389)